MSRRPQPQPMDPPGRVLFRLTFNVDNSSAADFNRFIEQMERELCSHIQRRRYCGKGATVLPCPQAQRTWFVIVLESLDREYSVPFFIEAENVYLRGYQNQAGALFEFAPDTSRANNLPARRYLGNASTVLSFNCSYNSIVQATEQTRVDPGLTLQALPEPQPQASRQAQRQTQHQATPRPNFGQERLRVAVRELAQENNTGSQHRTAQNLLLVIIRFCESVRLRSVRNEMVYLWTVPNTSARQPGRGISSAAIDQIHNWSTLSENMMLSARGLRGGDGTLRPFIWPRNGVAGVRSAAEAQEIVALVQFSGNPNEPDNPTPVWV